MKQTTQAALGTNRPPQGASGFDHDSFSDDIATDYHRSNVPHNIIYGSFNTSLIDGVAPTNVFDGSGSVLDTAHYAQFSGSLPKVPEWKRILDVALILLSAPLWLPVMLLLMCITRINSAGPIFYRQKRVGLGGQRFLMWKFRTMKVCAETRSHERYLEELMRNNKPMTKLDTVGDPRLVPFGRILRASGLDELPQIFNVLRGEMSLVGPRPCLPNEFVNYQQWQRKRTNALPGLTGYWQVNGKNRTTFDQMVTMDLFYIDTMAFWLDFKIILMTGRTMLRQVGETLKS